MVSGIGLGFRVDIAEAIINLDSSPPSFIELAPENWIGIGGSLKKLLKRASEKYPILTHGLSLSLGSPDPIDMDFLKEVKEFLDEYNVSIYSEHLSFSKCHNAHLYDLLPIPFREESAKHVAKQIAQVQDFLERKIAIENVSYYTPVTAEMEEWEFINSVLEMSDCNLLLDVNNVYVNSFNHQYDAKAFIDKLPLDRVVYIHMAGHEKRYDDLIIDTHSKPIIDPVYDLFEWTIKKIKPCPVLLERDSNFSDFDQILNELSQLEKITKKAWEKTDVIAYSH